MNSSFTFARIRGIEIGVHFTWLVVFALVTISLALGFFPQSFPALSPMTHWVLGVLASLLLFASVLVHELAHSFVAQSLGIQVRSITLFIFGGVSSIEGEPKRAREELLISAAGPISSIILGMVFGALLFVVPPANQALQALLIYLASVNVLLALFNLIPGFPLDGGRVLRGIAWGATGDFVRATNIATTVGQGVAYLFIFGGLFLAFNGAFLSGIWIAFIGWFLSNAAEAARQQTRVQHSFADVRVLDLMNREPVTIPPDLTLRDMVDEYVLARNIRAIPVVDGGGEMLGLVTISDLRKVPRERWDVATVGEVMTPTASMVAVTPETNAGEALKAMGQKDVNQVPVVTGNRLVGLLSRGNIIRFLQVREEPGTHPY